MRPFPKARSAASSQRRQFVRIFAIAATLVVLAAFLSVSIALAVTVVVKPTAMDGWNIQTFGTGTAGFETGPGVPPAGSGSAELKVGTDTGGIDRAEFRNVNYHGVKLSDLTELSYKEYITAGSGCVAPYILLSVDVDADGVFNPGGGIDDGLFFEPCYQTGTYGTDPPAQVIPVQNGGVVATGTWQTWDALIGGWWSNSYGGAGGPPLTTLPAYLTKLAGLGYPNPKIANSDSCLGGLRVRVGPGPPVWNNFEGNADDLRVGVSGSTTIYDFEYEPNPIPPCTPTTPTPGPIGVGGVVELLTGERDSQSDTSIDGSIAAAIAAGSLALLIASWFAWRRVRRDA